MLNSNSRWPHSIGFRDTGCFRYALCYFKNENTFCMCWNWPWPWPSTPSIHTTSLNWIYSWVINRWTIPSKHHAGNVKTATLSPNRFRTVFVPKLFPSTPARALGAQLTASKTSFRPSSLIIYSCLHAPTHKNGNDNGIIFKLKINTFLYFGRCYFKLSCLGSLDVVSPHCRFKVAEFSPSNGRCSQNDVKHGKSLVMEQYLYF